MRLQHRHFKINTLGRDYVVGDLHGCYDEFQTKLKEINFNPNTDRMFSVGDLVDRGPKNIEAAMLIKEPWFFAVRGNHEDMYIRALTDHRFGDMQLYHQNGGDWVNGVDDAILNDIMKLFKSLPISMEIETKHGNIGITHAESYEDWNDVKTTDNIAPLMWNRDVVQYSKSYNVANIYMTYHGHTPLRGVKQIGNCRFIDTGAFLSTEKWKRYNEPGFLTVEVIN